jgi:glycosyltransferase involved in cell wall biosynthesis
VIGGWIESLETEITKVPELELGIVFKWSKTAVPSFVINQTKYYPVFRTAPNGRVQKISQRWSHKGDGEASIQQYLDIINEFNPDVIHIFGTESDFGLIVPRVSIPCIIHIQGNLVVSNYKWFSGISMTDVLRYSKKSMLLKGQGFLHDYFYYRNEAKREKKIFRYCRFFMGRTDWDKYLTLSLSPGSKYFHCEEIMRKQFYDQQWKKDSLSDYTIISTIRNNIYKGLETIFECKKILQTCLPGFNIKWKIAGLKNEEEIAYLLERKYRDKFINNDIHLLGPLQVDDLIDEMLKANLFVHPSHIDNSPNSVCEAMMLGMPVIATYAGGTPSLIQNKREGLLIQDGDPYALAGAIVELINNKKYASDLGTNARSRALARHNREDIVQSVLTIYNSIIGERENAYSALRKLTK